jgi:tetratricopeptide (TPR) repeat protein
MSFWTNTAVSNRAVNLARSKESIAILQRAPKSAVLGDAWYGLGRLHEAAAENAEAASAYEQGVAAMIAAGDEKNAAVAGGRQMRARVLGYVGRFDEAHRELLAAQTLFNDTVGAEHRFSVDVRAELAEVAHQIGDSTESIQLFKRTLDEQTRLRGASHNSTLRTQRLLAEALYDIGRFDEAIVNARDALERSRTSATPSPIYEARLLSLLGRAHVRRGELVQASALLTEAQSMWGEIGEAYGKAVTALDLAMLHEARGEMGKASLEVDRALPLLKNVRGKSRNDYWRARVASARLADARERVDRLATTLSDLKQEPTHASYPRAALQVWQALAQAQAIAKTSSEKSGEFCKTLDAAVSLAGRLEVPPSPELHALATSNRQHCMVSSK